MGRELILFGCLADFATEDRDFLWRDNAENNAVGIEFDNADLHVFTDKECFTGAPADYEHACSPVSPEATPRGWRQEYAGFIWMDCTARRRSL